MQGLLPTAFDYLGRKQEQRWAKQAAGRQMDFQERMSNTAYQRAMADMKQAGINPIMVTKLGGASTPTGAMAKTPSMEGLGSKSMQAVNSASVVRQNLANTRLIEQEANYYDKKGYPKSVGTQAPFNIMFSEYLHKHPQEKDMIFKRISQFITGANDPTKVLMEMLPQFDSPFKDSKPFDWSRFINNDAFRQPLTDLILKFLTKGKSDSLYNLFSKKSPTGSGSYKNPWKTK